MRSKININYTERDATNNPKKEGIYGSGGTYQLVTSGPDYDDLQRKLKANNLPPDSVKIIRYRIDRHIFYKIRGETTHFRAPKEPIEIIMVRIWRDFLQKYFTKKQLDLSILDRIEIKSSQWNGDKCPISVYDSEDDKRYSIKQFLSQITMDAFISKLKVEDINELKGEMSSEEWYKFMQEI